MIFVTVSTGHFDALIQECNRLSKKYDFLGQIGDSQVLPVFPYQRLCYPDELEKNMRSAEIVVSHGGSGTLSMIYQLRKPSVIIPKQERYGETNDHQVDLARKWQDLGISLLCMEVNDLENRIEECRRSTFSYPRFSSLGEHLKKQLIRL